MYKGNKVSLVIPCYNEEEGIRYILAQRPPLVDEVVVVDNNSTDRTAEVARSGGAIVVNERERGYGRAYKRGLAAASGDIIVTMDGDGTYPPQAIELLLFVMTTEDADFISAMRWYSKSGEHKSKLRLLGNFILSATIRILFMRYIYDTQSGMWVFKRALLPRLEVRSDGMAFSEEIKIEAFTTRGVRAIEIPIYYGSRIGTSKLSLWKDGFVNLVFAFKKWLQIRLRRMRGR
ncbi:MAG: glycosyltransferase family 2 protein [Candidatus Aureabacteria bacterium]|nr:glycosyltransferase family 2 protein [Candidatus Auribacterota bacterium]